MPRGPVVHRRPSILRQPIRRQPAIIAPVLGYFAEGIMPISSGDGGNDSATGEAGAAGTPTEGLTGAGVANALGNALSTTLSFVGLALTAFAVPLGLAGKAVTMGLRGISTIATRGTADAQLAEEGSPAAASLAAQAEAEAQFAAENPNTAAVLGFFGLHATAQPTAEDLANEATLAHSASVAATLGITNTATQGFAYAGGYVDVNGNEIEVDTDGNPGVSGSGTAGTDAGASPSAGTGEGTASDGGGGAGGTGEAG